MGVIKACVLEMYGVHISCVLCVSPRPDLISQVTSLYICLFFTDHNKFASVQAE